MVKSMESRDPEILEIKKCFTSPKLKKGSSEAALDSPAAHITDDKSGKPLQTEDEDEEREEGFEGAAESEDKVSDPEVDDAPEEHGETREHTLVGTTQDLGSLVTGAGCIRRR